MTKLEPTKRFSNRVENYVKYRPSYPTAAYEHLQEVCGLVDTAVIADIGSGTGLFAELFLKQGNPVFGIEPNPDMRGAGETYLSAYTNFTSVDGTAESTTLPDQSVDFIVAGQAAHWFDLYPTRTEFERILKPDGVIALCWNQFDLTNSDFMIAYGQFFKQFSTLAPKRKRDPDKLPKVLLNEGFQRRAFPNPLSADLASFKGGILSSSSMPLDNAALVPAIETLFNQYQQDGLVTTEFVTHLLYNRIDSSVDIKGA